MNALLAFAMAFSALMGIVAGFILTFQMYERHHQRQQRALYHAFLDEMYRRLELERKFKQNTIQVVTPKRSNKVQIIRKVD